MNAAGLVVVFSLGWWLVFFLLLPIGIRVSDNPEAGHAPSAQSARFCGLGISGDSDYGTGNMGALRAGGCGCGELAA